MAQLERLRYFVVAAEELHFGRAAERLMIAPPSLSQQIKRLEGQLGVELFERDPHGLRLTAAGEVLLERARPALLGVDEAMAAARQAGAGLTGHLEVGFLPAAVGAVMGETVRQFAHEQPGVTVRLQQHDFSDTSAGLRSGKTDVAFVRTPIAGEQLCFEDLVVEPRVLAVPPGHRLAGRDGVHISETFDEPFLVMPNNDSVWRDFWLAVAHRRQPARLGPLVRSPDESFTAVLAGQGVLLTRRSIAARYEPEGVVVVALSGVEPSVGSIAWRATHETPLVRAFVAVARRVAEASRAAAA